MEDNVLPFLLRTISHFGLDLASGPDVMVTVCVQSVTSSAERSNVVEPTPAQRAAVASLKRAAACVRDSGDPLGKLFMDTLQKATGEPLLSQSAAKLLQLLPHGGDVQPPCDVRIGGEA